jgi:hypothetical protein
VGLDPGESSAPQLRQHGRDHDGRRASFSEEREPRGVRALLTKLMFVPDQVYRDFARVLSLEPPRDLKAAAAR